MPWCQRHRRRTGSTGAENSSSKSNYLEPEEQGRVSLGACEVSAPIWRPESGSRFCRDARLGGPVADAAPLQRGCCPNRESAHLQPDRVFEEDPELVLATEAPTASEQVQQARALI